MGKIYNSILGFLIISVFVLFALQFNCKKNNLQNGNNFTTANGKALPIAYFDVDTLISKYEFSKERQQELEQILQKANEEISNMQVVYEQKQRELEAMPVSDEKEKAMIALNKLRQENTNKEEKAKENIQSAQQRFQIELRKNIQEFIATYNTPQRFSFIINDEPGFIFYRDSALNITNDLVLGLNEMFKKKK